MTEPVRILMAGGGSGGHVFPGVAIADQVCRLARESGGAEVIFVGTARGLETRLVPASGYRLELLTVEPMVGGGAARVLRGAYVAASATVRARALVAELRPSLVVSVGGYAAGPLCLAARLSGAPLVVVEPNATMGLANRLLVPLAARVYVAFAELARTVGERARLVGVPLRASFLEKAAAASHADAARLFAPPGGDASRPPRILVLGGSHGAAPLNERMPGAVARIAESFPSVEVLHQTGRDREGRVREDYDRHEQLKASRVDVVPFVEDVAAALERADVVVARAGAITVAEIQAIGRAAVFVPFAAAANNHQFQNASALARLGAGVCVAQEAADSTRLALEITALLKDDAARARMAAAARASGRTDAAEVIARDVLALARDGVRSPRRHLCSRAAA